MKYATSLLTLLLFLANSGCSQPSSTENPINVIPGEVAVSAMRVSNDARRIARDTLIIDTHIDVPYRLYRNPDDVSQATTAGDFDYPRAMAGGLNAPFMSIYIPASKDASGEAYEFAVQSIASVEQLAAEHPDKFAIATCSEDLARHFEQNLISLPLGMENGGPISGQIDHLTYFFDQGIRYITLAHSKSNHISDSSYDSNEHWQGLSEFGKALIPQMNRLGIMVDVSHISDNAFWQVMALTQTPVLATHSSLRHFTPDFKRNMSDDMVVALAKQGGVIQINYGSAFLHRAAQDFSAQRNAAVLAYQQNQQLPDDDPALLEYRKAYSERHPYPYASIENVLDHIDRVVELGGIDAVGIGSDYDGVGDTLPTHLKDVSTYPNLIQGLLDRGYSEPDIQQILGGNSLRVWRAAEAYAESQGTAIQCRSA